MKQIIPRSPHSLLATLLLVCLIGASTSAQAAHHNQKNLLVVTVTKGFRHSSIPIAEAVLGQFGTQSHAFNVDFVRNDKEMAEKMSRAALKDYDGVIFANTSGALPLPDKEAFMDWLHSGNAFIGMHAGSDTFKQYSRYVTMLGGTFKTHNEQVEVEALVADQAHPASAPLGNSYTVFDEIYLLNNYRRERVHLLLSLDKHPNTKKPGHYPISWCKRYGKARVFYTVLGHRKDVWTSAPYQQHILGGIRWALGLESGSAKPQSTRATLTEREKEAGFKLLFNGQDLSGWKLRKPDGHPSWSAQNGMLVNEIPEGGHGTDLVSKKRYKDFVVRFEYMVPDGANSGFYLRGRKEIQILEDFESRELSKSGNGAFYSVKAPDFFASRPAGEWQTVEAKVVGNKITVVLNGVKIHDGVTVDRATGGQINNNVGDAGPILLQGNHGPIAFRHLRIKPIH